MKLPRSPQWLIERFTGLFGDGLFVRLDDEGRDDLLALPGAKPLAPMGRPSKKSIVLPPSMLEDEEAVKGWMRRALAHARSLPAKTKAKAKKARARR